MKVMNWLKANAELIGLVVFAVLLRRVSGLSDTEVFQLLVFIGLWEIYRTARKINGKLDKIVASNEAGK